MLKKLLIVIIICFSLEGCAEITYQKAPQMYGRISEIKIWCDNKYETYKFNYNESKLASFIIKSERVPLKNSYTISDIVDWSLNEERSSKIDYKYSLIIEYKDGKIGKITADYDSLMEGKSHAILENFKFQNNYVEYQVTVYNPANDPDQKFPIKNAVKSKTGSNLFWNRDHFIDKPGTIDIYLSLQREKFCITFKTNNSDFNPFSIKREKIINGNNTTYTFSSDGEKIMICKFIFEPLIGNAIVYGGGLDS